MENEKLEPIGEINLEQKRIEDCEWCFQFDDDEPQVFAWTDPELKTDEDPTVTFTISNVKDAYISFTHSESKKTFRLFARPITKQGKKMRKEASEKLGVNFSDIFLRYRLLLNQ